MELWSLPWCITELLDAGLIYFAFKIYVFSHPSKVEKCHFYLIKYSIYQVKGSQVCFYLEVVKYVWSGTVHKHLHPTQLHPFNSSPSATCLIPSLPAAAALVTALQLHTHTHIRNVCVGGMKECAVALLRCGRLILYWSATGSLEIYNACLRRRALHSHSVAVSLSWLFLSLQWHERLLCALQCSAVALVFTHLSPPISRSTLPVARSLCHSLLIFFPFCLRWLFFFLSFYVSSVLWLPAPPHSSKWFSPPGGFAFLLHLIISLFLLRRWHQRSDLYRPAEKKKNLYIFYPKYTRVHLDELHLQTCSTCGAGALFLFHHVCGAAGFYNSSAWSLKLRGGKKTPSYSFISSLFLPQMRRQSLASSIFT